MSTTSIHSCLVQSCNDDGFSGTHRGARWSARHRGREGVGAFPTRPQTGRIFLFGAQPRQRRDDECERPLEQQNVCPRIAGQPDAGPIAHFQVSDGRQVVIGSARGDASALVGLLDKAKAYPVLKASHPEAVEQIDYTTYDEKPRVMDYNDFEIGLEEVFWTSPAGHTRLPRCPPQQDGQGDSLQTGGLLTPYRGAALLSVD